MSHIMTKPALPYANNKGAVQPAHPRSLISTFIICCQGSTVSIGAISKISWFTLKPIAEQAGLSFTCSKSPEDRISSGVAPIYFRCMYYAFILTVWPVMISSMLFCRLCSQVFVAFACFKIQIFCFFGVWKKKAIDIDFLLDCTRNTLLWAFDQRKLAFMKEH